MKKVVIINGHPDRESFCHALHRSYKKGALQQGYLVDEIILADMQFDLNLKYGYRQNMDWEPDLQKAWGKIERATHIVWIFPIWWGTVPALLKGFIDRVFLPDIAFKLRECAAFPDKMLKGKTSELINTLDSPTWYHRFVIGNASGRMIRKSIGAYCGIKNIRSTYLSTISVSTPEKRDRWLKKAEELGRK